MAILPGLADQFPKLKEGHCKWIRSKEMFYETERREIPNYAARIYWCHYTQKPLGPDDKPCDMEQCTADRPCFEKV